MKWLVKIILHFISKGRLTNADGEVVGHLVVIKGMLVYASKQLENDALSMP